MTMVAHLSRLAAVGIHLAGIGLAMSMPSSSPPEPPKTIPITLTLPPPEPPAPEVEQPKPEPKPEPKPVVKEAPPPPPVPHPVAEPPPAVIASAETSVAEASVPTPEPPPPLPPPPSPGNVKAVNDYNSKLQSWLLRHHRYPSQARAKREQGTAMVWFVIDRQGRLQGCRLQRTSGSALLDEAAVKLVERSAPFPAAPDEVTGQTIERVIPVDFYIR